MTISVVSGTYNRLKLLRRMVGSVRRSAGDVSYEIIMVDGGSTDGTTDWCKSQKDIILIEQGKLLGAIKAFNAGAEVAQGEYVALLNDDITVRQLSLQHGSEYLDKHPRIGQIAFHHYYQRRGDPQKGRIQGAYGYPYGQCCLTRRWLGDAAGWWGELGMKTYGGDTQLSLRIWEMGWIVKAIPECSVIDYEHEDELRTINSDTPRRGGRAHPDLMAFSKAWNDRMPDRNHWIPAPVHTVMHKAARGNLRTLRFKGMMAADHDMRHALIDELSRYGTGQQINQMAEARKHGMAKYQDRVKQIVANFRPDLIIFQAQRKNNVLPETVRWLREKYPDTFLVNFDGDCHFPLTSFQFEIAAAMHLQLVVSPTLFQHYAAQGIGVGYWPIGIERDYDVPRAEVLDGPDVLFLGALYGEGVFPEAITRRDAVKALWNWKEPYKFSVFGNGWNTVGISCSRTNEAHDANAKLMARTKMTLSISQASQFWGYSSDRLYNICSTGCPALVQRFAGMEQHGYIHGETCIAWETITEMLTAARYYLKHDEERERIGAAGKKMTLERHTWKRRVEGLFAMIEGL